MKTPADTRLFGKRIVNRLGHPIGINPFPRSFPNPIAARSSDPSFVFDEIYQQNYWGSEESRSGVGSESLATSGYASRLLKLLTHYDLRRVFDAPCGDLNWMVHVIRRGQLQYIGGDISSAVIEDASRTYPDVDLRVFDIISSSFPDADVWHCRDCLFHLPFESIRKTIENYLDSSIPYAMLTSHRSWLLHKNLDVDFGGFRLLDLERAPLDFPAPVARVRDFAIGRDFPRYVGLWRRDQIARAASNWRK